MRSIRRTESARDLALEVLERVDTGSFVEHALSERLTDGPLRKEERSLATELVYGVTRWRMRLDAIIDSCARPRGKPIKPAIRQILRIALYQLILLERIPPHAAVDEAVKQARRRFGQGLAGFVNAILRNVLRNLPAVDPPPTDDPESLATHFSHPPWLVSRWIDELGYETTRRVLAHNNSRTSIDLRVNNLKVSLPDLLHILDQAGCAPRINAAAPHAIRVTASQGAVHRIQGYADGLFAVQGLASQLIAPLLRPQPGNRILDACAAPGGKTAHIAALTANGARVVAVDSNDQRLEDTRVNLDRLGVQGVELIKGDAEDPDFIGSLGQFDRVLLDAPCTGLGVLRHNPEARYRLNPEDAASMGDRQRRMIGSVARVLKVRGLLLYSVCTVSREETLAVADTFLIEHPNYSLIPITGPESGPFSLADHRGYLVTFPPPDIEPMDGFFAARFRRDV